MDGMYLGVLAFSIVFATGFYWFRLVAAVSLPKNRVGFLACMLIGATLGIVALLQGTDILNGVLSVLAILLGAMFLFTWLIARRREAANI